MGKPILLLYNRYFYDHTTIITITTDATPATLTTTPITTTTTPTSTTIIHYYSPVGSPQG